MNERTNTPFKRLFFALSIVPLIIPGILFVVAWILLGSPKIGLVNLALQALFGTELRVRQRLFAARAWSSSTACTTRRWRSC